MSTARHLLWPVALACAVGCSRPKPGDVTLHLAPETAGTPVVRFNGQAVTAEALEASLASMSPALRARYAQPDARRTYAEDVARFQLLVQKAAQEGLANDPEVISATERMMVHRLIAKAVEATPPNDAEVEAYFQAHQAEFARPEMVRLGEILVSAKKGDAGALKKAKSEAAALLKKVQALAPTDVAGFSELARHASDDARAKLFGGDLRYLTRELLERRYGPEVAKAGFALEKPGDATTVETDQGVYLLRLLNRSQAFTPTLAQVKPQIVARLSAEQRNQRLTDFLAQAEKDAHLAVDEKALEAVKVDASAPAKPLGHPALDVFAKPRAAAPRAAHTLAPRPAPRLPGETR